MQTEQPERVTYCDMAAVLVTVTPDGAYALIRLSASGALLRVRADKVVR